MKTHIDKDEIVLRFVVVETPPCCRLETRLKMSLKYYSTTKSTAIV